MFLLLEKANIRFSAAICYLVCAWIGLLFLENCTASHPPLDVFHSFPEIFADELGCISDCIAKVHLREDAIPKCMPSRPVPYAIRAKVDQELDRLEKEGIIERVDFAEWASPIVIVKKKNGDIRMSADFKITINKYIDPQQHPIPNPTNLLSSLSGGQIFSKLDLRQAYVICPVASWWG